jgi:hypothetical protein
VIKEVKFKVFDLNDSGRWRYLLSTLPLDQQDIYFSPEYYQLYEEYGDGKAQCFIFEKDGEIALYPFLINSVNELGFDLDTDYYDIQGAYGYNGVISTSYEDSFISSFYKAFDDYILNNNIIAEFTRYHPIIQNDLFSVNMNIIEDRKTVFLDISKEYDYIWNNCYSGINRNMIRKALKNNISILVSDKSDDYSLFFDIYMRTMENIGADKYYYFSDGYFKNFKVLLSNNHKLILAKIDDKLICAMILMFHSEYAHYHLSGRVREFSNTGVNNLILDEAVKIAKKEGCSAFHFGGGTTNLQNDSLLKFKSNFSNDKLTFRIGKKIHNKIVYGEVINQWKLKFPEKVEMYNNFLLKYRY